MQPNKLVEGYMKMSRALDSSIKKLNRELEPISKLLRERTRLEGKREALDAQITEGLDRLEGLKEAYFHAGFMGDTAEQNQLAERRDAIKQELEALQADKATTEKALADIKIPSEDIGKLAAQVDVLHAPEYTRFLWELKLAVQDHHSDQMAAIDELQRSLAHTREYMDADSYHEKRKAIDHNYVDERVGV